MEALVSFLILVICAAIVFLVLQWILGLFGFPYAREVAGLVAAILLLYALVQLIGAADGFSFDAD